MRIVHLIPYVDSKYGGPPYVSLSMCKFFKKRGIESTIITVGNKNSSEDIRSFKLTTNTFFFSIAYMLSVAKHIQKSEVVYIHGIYSFVALWGGLIAWLIGKDIYLLPHGMLDKDSINSGNITKNIFRKLYLSTLGLFQVFIAKKIVFNSEKEHNNSLLNKNSVVIPNGVDIEAIDALNCTKNVYESGVYNILFFGRIHPIKGIDIIMDAFKLLSSKYDENSIRLNIVGDGDKEFVDKIKKEMDIKNVKFLGHIDGDEKYCYLKQCDLYLQPSKTEGLSVAMLEALACGCEIITTDSVGLSDELKKSHIATVIRYDKNELFRAIECHYLKKCKFSRESIKEFVKKKYSWENVIEKYINLMGCYGDIRNSSLNGELKEI